MKKRVNILIKGIFRFSSLAPILVLTLAVSNGYKYPQNYFRLPIPDGRELLLAGTFGELRPNHFHGGLDIKTLGVVGTELVSAAEGYVSRIKVSSYGYGRTLYIDHPNGYTTVYAHLQKYSPRIEKFVQALQSENESWELEVFPGKNEIKVEKGEFVAVSGNTGGSRAPHLHFEIRDSKTQTPIDPLLFGYKIQDNITPRIYGVMVYPIGEGSMVKIVYSNGKSTTSTSQPIKARISGGSGKYSLRYIKEIVGHGKVGFAVKTYDYHNGSSNKLGVPLIELKADGDTKFKQDIEKIPFSGTRYLNALIDFNLKARYGSYYNRAFVIPGNKLDVYDGDGILELTQDTVLDMEMILKDRSNNTSKLTFKLRGIESYTSPSTTIGQGGDTYFLHGEKNRFENSEVKVSFLKNSFYDDFQFRYKEYPKKSYGYSLVHSIHNNYTPVHKYYSVSIKAHGLPDQYQDKAVITRNGRYEGGYYQDGWVKTRSRYFGKFQIRVDTVSPVISPLNVRNGYNMKWRKDLRIKISDNLSGIKAFKAWIDGEFIIMDHEYKYSLLQHYFQSPPDGLEHELKIWVTDKVGNTSERTVKYIR